MDREVEIFAHRSGGWLKENVNHETKDEKGANSITGAMESFKKVGGCEVDVTFTSDGVAVVTHDNVSGINFEEFKRRYPDHATLESWVEWMRQPGMEDRKLYLDLKGVDQDPFLLVRELQSLGERVVVGSKDPVTVFKALLARKLLGSGPRVYLQIPDPLFPSVAVAYATNIAESAGLSGLDEDPASAEKLNGLRPDGVHFYWPENLVKDAVAEVVKHGEFVPVTDSAKTETAVRFPNIPILHDLQRWRLRSFVRRAKAVGLKVMAGSAASAETMKRMVEWGVDGIMPNDPNVSPVVISARETPTIGDKHKNTKSFKEGSLTSEPQDNNRVVYDQFARMTVRVGALNKLMGF